MTLTQNVRVTPQVARDGAARIARDTLIRCWLRESGHVITREGRVRIELPAADAALIVEVLDAAPTGFHTLGAVTHPDGRPASTGELIALLAGEAAARTGRPDHTEARERIAESSRRQQGYASARAQEGEPPQLPRWLLAEQDLLSGHPWHPMTKSRDGLADHLDARYSPEARGSFPVHWFAAAPEVAAHGGTGRDVPALMRRLSGGLADQVPPDWLLVPAHPWQADDLVHRPAAVELLRRNLLRDLGPGDQRWWATSSLRTVAHPGAEVMLKLSMGLRVTNSRRENTRDEGLLAAHTAELVDAGLGAALAASHPQFSLVLDRGWLGVDALDSSGLVGLETVVRDVPFSTQEDTWCAGSLFDPRPDLAAPPVAELVRRSAALQGLPVQDAACAWLRRYLDVVVEPLLWLHGTWGVGLEAHLQNTLVTLDDEGLPCRGWYRDNQGWYAAESAVTRLRTLLPTVGVGVALVFGDQLVADRVAYYLGVNHVLGVVAALAVSCAVPEGVLLDVVRDVLRRNATGASASSVATLLLGSDTLPTKANLLTGVDGRDEVESPVETQSVYVTIPNPLREVTA